MIIVVGVVIETIKQIESLVLVRHYKGFLENLNVLNRPPRQKCLFWWEVAWGYSKKRKGIFYEDCYVRELRVPEKVLRQK